MFFNLQNNHVGWQQRVLQRAGWKIAGFAARLFDRKIVSAHS